jgi:hypothetical protein
MLFPMCLLRFSLREGDDGALRLVLPKHLAPISELRLQSADSGVISSATLAASEGRPTRLESRVLRVLGMPLPGPNPGIYLRGLAMLLVLSSPVAAFAASPVGRNTERRDSQTAKSDGSDGVAQSDKRKGGPTRIRNFVRVVAGDGTISVEGEVIPRAELDARST